MFEQQPDAEVPRRRAEQQRDAARRAGTRRRRSSLPTSSTSSSSSSATAHAASSSASAWPRAVTTFSSARALPPVTRVNWWKVSSRRSITPRNSPGMPTGHVSGASGRPSVSVEVVDHPERLHAGPVVLVHERDQRDAARPGDLEELLGLRLDAAGGVDQDHGGVDRGQHPQRVLGEVLVARGVEQVEDDALVLEAQHGGGDRDAAAALEVHPVRRRRLLPPARGDRPRLADRARVQQQLLGEGGLARVRVRDDGEGAPARRLLHHESVIHEDSGYERYVRAAASHRRSASATLTLTSTRSATLRVPNSAE